MTLVLIFDLDIVKIYCHTKNEVSMSRHSNIIRTDRQYENITFLHMQTVKTIFTDTG